MFLHKAAHALHAVVFFFRVHLQGQPVQCPQCKGTGTGENNASDDDEIDRMLQRAKWHMDILKGRLMLEKLRYPPR